MHGATLVTTEELVCVTATADDAVFDVIRDWIDEQGLRLSMHVLGEDEELPPRHRVDRTLGLAVGGDGTFLEATRLFAPRGIPVAGVSRGTLSFLSRIPPENVRDALREILQGRARISERQRLAIEGQRMDALALNDVTFEPPHSVRERKTCAMEVFVDEEYVGRYDGGGLVVSTPTGSTAMALSADGVIQRPEDNETIQVAALHSDTLGHAPLVFDASREVTVVPDSSMAVWVDGGRAFKRISDSEPVRLTGTDRPVRIVRTSYEQSFSDALVSKLGWALRDEPQATDDIAQDYGVREGTAREWLPEDLLPAVSSAFSHSAEKGRFTARGDASAFVPPEADSGDSDSFRERARRVAIEAATAAGDLARRYATRIDGERDGDRRKALFEEAERGSSRVLTTVIASSFPEHAIQVEGQLFHRGHSDYTWLLDPIDGHTNFVHGNPSYCTTVALLEDEEPVVGVVYAPGPEELFHAVSGRGAYRNDAPIEPTDRDDLAVSMLVSGYDPDGQFLETFYPHTRGVRKLGSQALNLCYVAAGSADALWEFNTYPWDVAAGLCILRTAGGQATDAEGEPFVLQPRRGGRTPLLASNGSLHPELLSLFEET